MLTPGAGIYAHGSYVTVKNITITQDLTQALELRRFIETGIIKKS